MTSIKLDVAKIIGITILIYALYHRDWFYLAVGAILYLPTERIHE